MMPPPQHVTHGLARSAHSSDKSMWHRTVEHRDRHRDNGHSENLRSSPFGELSLVGLALDLVD